MKLPVFNLSVITKKWSEMPSHRVRECTMKEIVITTGELFQCNTKVIAYLYTHFISFCMAAAITQQVSTQQLSNGLNSLPYARRKVYCQYLTSLIKALLKG